MTPQQAYQQIIQEVAAELNLPSKIVDCTYKAFWKFIRTKIEELPLKESISIDEFDKLDTSFNVPSLGKLACKRDKYKLMQLMLNKNYD